MPEPNIAELPDHLQRLLDEALTRYRATVFWNMRPSAAPKGVLAAAMLAAEMRKELAAIT